MDRKFTLSCCSTVDLPYSYMESRDIPVLFYTYVVDGREYDDDMGRDPEALPRFYAFLKEGKLPQTSQINVAAYTEFFEKLLDKGGDVLHIAFTSGQSGSVHNAFLAAEELKDRYPGQRLVLIDSLCSSSGYGLLVDYAADMRDEGKSLDELHDWIEANKLRLHHWFFSTDLTFYVKGGRISKASGFFGTMLNICPLLNMDNLGRLIPREKIRTKKKVIKTIVDRMEECADDGLDYSGKCFISQSACVEDAKAVAALVEERFPKLNGKVEINYIGTTIGSHTGPGTVALFFWGKERVD